MNCLAGCISKFYCPQLNSPIEGHNISPWVRAMFSGAGETITVGNESSPNHGNTACIKSFSYGVSDGFQFDLEIVDQEAGIFPKFLDNMVKCVSKVNSAEYDTVFKWGWTINNCDGPATPKTSPTLKGKLLSTEVNYSDGKIKYNMTFSSTGDMYFDMREDEVFGKDGQTMKLEDGIRKLCDLPPKLKVQFCKKNPDGSDKCGCIDWKYFGCGGPNGVWSGDSQNRLATISKWIEPFQTSNNKGLIMMMEPGVPGSLIIWEDPTPNCGESINCDGNSLGTFIVNGGKCSNVIEFTPKFSWANGFPRFGAGGDGGSGIDGGRTQQEDKKNPCNEAGHGKNVGMEEGITPSRYAFDAFGPTLAHKETNDAQNKHQKANGKYQGLNPIEAELRILGDPRPEYCSKPSQHTRASIISINPFHITGDINSGCGDWLAKPGCNEVISNKNWFVLGIEHSIKEGSYITTIKLSLSAPSIDAANDDPLGGPGSGGYKPKNTCF